MTEEVEIDLHGFSFYEAKNELLITLVSWIEAGYETMRIIHGYKHGQDIKNYIFGAFQHDFGNQFPHLSIDLTIENLGSTLIQVTHRKTSCSSLKPKKSKKMRILDHVSRRRIKTIKCRACGYKHQITEDSEKQMQCKRCKRPL